jgi:hypothetical protein
MGVVMQWIVHTQGPDEPVYVIEAEGTARFIARLDEDGKTRAEVMATGFLLAAAPALLAALEDLTDRVDLVLYAGYVGHERIAKARAAIAMAQGTDRHPGSVGLQSSRLLARTCSERGG